MKTLITAWEVIKYSPVSNSYPTSHVCDHIARRERKIFRSCLLGDAFYGVLLNDLIDTEGLPLYSTETTYTAGERVNWDGLAIESLKDANNVNPDEDDVSDPYWKVMDKFETECYQTLWDDYMKHWIAFEVLFTSLRYATYQATSKGLMIAVEQDSQTVNVQAFNAYKMELKNDADDQLEQMIEYIKDEIENDSDCYSTIEELCSDCNTVKQRRRRRFYFKN